MKKQPKISIVTVVMNDASGLEKTIQSVISQTYSDYEFIIIDGKSNDNTVEIIQKYSQYISSFISSETDSGIFDAMNKGVRLATGKWIYFLNARDVFESAETLNSVAPLLKDSIDVAYGSCRIDYGDALSGPHHPEEFTKSWRGMPFSHQSVFCKTELIAMHMFDCSFNLAGDFDLMSRLIDLKSRFHKIDIIVSRSFAGGCSDTNRIKLYYQYWKISRRYIGLCRCTAYFALKSFIEILKIMAKIILPSNLVRRIQLSKYSTECSAESDHSIT